MALPASAHPPPNLALQRSKRTFKFPSILITGTITSDSNLTLPPLPSLLQRCTTTGELHQIHAQMLKTTAARDPLLLTELLSCCQSINLDYALKILSSLPRRSSIHWNTLMQGYSLSAAPEQCLILYIRLLEDEPLLLNAHTFPPLLKACTKVNSVSQGRQVHGCAIKCGAMADPYVMNSLIQMYFGCGRPDDGQLVFDRMPDRSVVSWNCVIGGFAEMGLWEKVKSLFWMMVREQSVVPNSVTLVRMVVACTRSSDFEAGKRVHQYIMEKGILLCLNLGNALMNMFAKFGDMQEAYLLFDQMQDPDVVSWTTMVSGYAGVGLLGTAREFFDRMPLRNLVSWNAMIAGYVLNICLEDALFLFKEMLVLDVKIDKATLLTVLSACARLPDLFNGKVIHGYIYKIGIDMTLDLLNSLLGLYTKCARMDLAALWFNKMSVKNEITWTLMVEGYVHSGAKDVALKFFQKMPYKDVASWNALITALAQNNYFSEALDTFKEMQTRNVRPNCLTFVSALSACARVGALELGKWIHSYIERNSIQIDAQLSSSLIDMYARCGCVELSLGVFDSMPVKDQLAWSTIIGGLAVNGHSKLALDHFKQMIEYGVQPDAIAFIGVLSACSHAGLVEEGKHYFNSMTTTYGISPMMEHYSCMVDLLGRHGFLREAKDFIEGISILSNGVAIWGALLGACRLHGDIELAEYSANKLLELDPSNSGAYVLLSNVYAKASSWENVGKIRSIMKGKGVEKTPGCSLIEVNGVVSEFLVGDVSHPQRREIYMMLDGLENMLQMS